MEDYIVRIYRRKEENGGLFGVVEEIGIEGKRAFQSMEELVKLLRGDLLEDLLGAEQTRVAIPITVEGRNSLGKQFSENTVIEELGPCSAEFRLNAPVLEGDELTLLIVPICGRLKRNAKVANIVGGAKQRKVSVVFR